MENINYVSILISILSSIASVAIAIAALKNARVAEKNNQLSTESFKLAQRSNDARIYLDMMDIYMSGEFKNALRVIRNAKNKEPDTFPAEWYKSYRNNEPWGMEVDDARSKIKYFYRNIAQLYKEELIGSDLLNALCKPQGWRVLIDLVEPMEQMINSNYNRSTYEIIRSAGEKNDSQGFKAPSRV